MKEGRTAMKTKSRVASGSKTPAQAESTSPDNLSPINFLDVSEDRGMLRGIARALNEITGDTSKWDKPIDAGWEDDPSFFTALWENDDGPNSVVKALMGVHGLLELDARTHEPESEDPKIARQWENWVLGAFAEYNRLHPQITDPVLRAMRGIGIDVNARDWMRIARKLDANGLIPDNNLPPLVQRELADISNPPANIEGTAFRDILLQPLETDADTELQADNIRATQAVYYAAMLDELRLFDVVDKLVEHFQNGMLPLGRGAGGELLYRYWRNSIQRLTGLERRGMYSRCFGMTTGAPGEPANLHFESCWMRLVSGVSEYFRQQRINDMFQAANPMNVSKESVRKAARDLASNLSLHGYGVTYFAATELTSQINDALTILKHPEIRSAYGARDHWQVIEQVNALDLGTPRNTYRYRTMAFSGAVVMRWLAQNASRLTGSISQILSDDVVRAAIESDSATALRNPNDYDLVNACEAWLAVNGVPDTKVEEFSQPIESPMVTSRPISVPDAHQAVQDALAGAGVSLGTAARWARPQGVRPHMSNGAAFTRY
jgi:hypothetical protein